MKKRIITTALALAMLSNPAYAAVNCADDITTRVITVSGSVSGTEFTNIISFNIENEEGENIYKKFIPTSDGSFTYDFKLPDSAETGKYKFIFSSYESENPEIAEYNYISETDLAAIVQSFNNTQDAEETVLLIEQNKSVMALSEKWYEMMSTGDKLLMAQAVFDNKGEGYSEIKEIKEIAEKIMAISALDNSDTKEDIAQALKDFEGYCNLSENVTLYDEYMAADEKTKNSAQNILASESFDSFADVYKAFDEAVLLALISNAQQPADILSLIEENRSVITFDLTAFDKSNKTATALYLEGKEVSSMEILSGYITEAYNAQIKNNSQGSSGGSSGGGGGSSGGGSSFANVPAAKNPAVEEEKVIFNDLESVKWAENAINYLAQEKIVSGVKEGKFNPFGTVTREQFALMLVNAFGLTKEGAEVDFTDVAKEHWAYKAIASAYESGVVSGMGDGSFGLGENIKRQDIAVMTLAAAIAGGYSIEGEKESNLTDMESVSEYAKDSVEKMVKAGIINGFAEDNTFRPFENATRAQAAVIIYTILRGGK